MDNAIMSFDNDGPEVFLIVQEIIESFEDGPELILESEENLSLPRKKRRSRCRGYKKLRHLIDYKFCLVCGKTDKLTVDHIIPRVHGGAIKAKQNLMFLCETCNSTKGDKMPVEWLETITSSTVKKFCPKRHELLLEMITVAVEFNALK